MTSIPVLHCRKYIRTCSGLMCSLCHVTIIRSCLCVITVDLPTVLECTRFQGLRRTINIPQEIGRNYSQFGMFLLDDPNGTKVDNIECKHRGDPERINTEILREWDTGREKKPVTWKTLIGVLRDIELGTLASEIEAIKLKSTTSTKL